MSEENPLGKIFESITNGLTDEEKGGLFAGFHSGLEQRGNELARLQQLNHGIVNGLLSSLDTAMKSEPIKQALSEARSAGASVKWLQQQIETGLVQAIDLRIEELSHAN